MTARAPLAGTQRLHLLASIAWLGFTLRDLLAGQVAVPAIEATCGVAGLLAAARAGRASETALGAISLIGLVTLALVQDGPGTLAVWWIPLVPLLAGIGQPARSPFGWVLASLASIAGLNLARGLVGWKAVPADVPVNQLAMTVLVGVAVVFTQRAYATQVGALNDQGNMLALQAETLRQTRDAAVATASERMRFAATLAHEVRTPLNGMLGIAQLLLDGLQAPRERDLARILVSSGRNLQRIADDILEFSRIEADGLSTENLAFDPTRLVEEMLQLFAVQAWEKGLDLASDWPSGAPPVRLSGDPTRLRQVLANLVANALKFTARGAVVVHVESRGTDAEPRLRFLVTDTGPGLSDQEIGRLFRPFSQANPSISARYGGTGLGLSLVKRIVEELGGTVGVTSTVGVGATFWFELPFRAVTLSIPEPRSSQRVWVAEPREATARALTSRLTAWGHIVRNGLDAWDSEWDVALVNAELPLGDTRGRRVVLLSPDPRPVAPDRRFPTLRTPFRSEELQQLLGATGPRVGASSFDPDLARRFPLRILVVDDAETNRRVASLMLERLGYQADLAEGGAEAIAAIQRRGFDLVLLDLVMPEMDGLELARRLRAVIPQARIVVMTANILPDQISAFEALGVVQYLPKPFLAEELVAVLRDGRATPTGVPVVADPAIERLLAICNGDRLTLAGLVRTFIDTLDDQVARCQAGLAVGDREAIRRAAHALRGSAPMFGADPVGQVATRLEALAPGTGPLEEGVAELAAAAAAARATLIWAQAP